MVFRIQSLSLFLRAAPRLHEFMAQNKKVILECNKDLFIYSNEEINEILLLLYLMAPLNDLFFQLQKDDSNSAYFVMYYFKLIQQYLDDIELIAAGGRLRGDLGLAIKSFKRFNCVDVVSNIEYDLIQIFGEAKKLFMKEYYAQQFSTVHLVMDALDPFSKFSLIKKMQTPEEYKVSLGRLCNFFESYLESSVTGNKSEKCLVNLTDTNCSKRVLLLHNAMEAINSEQRNEFTRYMLECKANHMPETIQDMPEGIHEFWISRRKGYPELSKLALSLLYLKCSTADIERSFSILQKYFKSSLSIGFQNVGSINPD